MRNDNLYDYQDIFGDLDFKEGDDSRSVYSPAAYMADLLQLMDDEFATVKETDSTAEDSPDSKSMAIIDNRRQDIRARLLNEENTYTLVPYLTIVNEVLETKLDKETTNEGGETIKEGVFSHQLLNANYPTHTPFDLSNEELKLHLKYLGVSAEQFHKLFATEWNEDVIVRESLGLSDSEWTELAQDFDINEIKPRYGFDEGLDNNDFSQKIANVPTFLSKTGLTPAELRELLDQNTHESEAHARALFYINQHSGNIDTYVGLNNTETTLLLKNTTQTSLTEKWLARVHRSVRLAKKIGTTFTDVDRVLRHLAYKAPLGKLNGESEEVKTTQSFRIFAAIKELKQKLSVTFEEVMALLTNMNEVGHGDSELPQDLFNTTFNNRCVKQEGSYIKGNHVVPHQYLSAEYEELTYSSGILTQSSEAFRKRVEHALKLPKNGVATILQALKARDQDEALWENTGNKVALLNLLYRFTRLSSALDISYDDLFILFDLIEQDYSLDTFVQHDCFVTFKPSSNHALTLFQGDNLNDKIWLLQTLIALTTWMRAHDFSAQELWKIASGDHHHSAESEDADKQLISQLHALHAAFKPLRIDEKTFQKGEFDARAAGVIFRNLVHQRNTAHPHLLYLADDDKAQSTALAQRAIHAMAHVEYEDFMGLGVEQSVKDKIHRNLVFRGLVDGNGSILIQNLPEKEDEFYLETDFSALAYPLFQKIHALYQEGASQAEDVENVIIHVYPSDLRQLELSAPLTDAEYEELYDNLMFNHYISEDGQIKDSAFFSLHDNYQNFDTNTHINALTYDVFTMLHQQVLKFELAALPVAKSVFDELQLNEKDLDDLIENLQFNGYLDASQRLINKVALLNTTADEFKLALPFFAHQARIHAILQHKVVGHQRQYLTVDNNDMSLLAERLVAHWAFEDLQHQFLDNHYLTVDAVTFFEKEENHTNLVLGYYFDPQATRAVFMRMKQIVKHAQAYQLTDRPLLEKKFFADEVAELMSRLIEKNLLTETRHIPVNKLEYLLDSNNVVGFNIAGFEDFNKDIFFLLQGIAKRTKSTIDEIISIEKALANKQHQTLFNHLKGIFGLDSTSMTTITKAMFGEQLAVVKAWMLPLFATADIFDAITELPDDPAFISAMKRISQFGMLADKLQLSHEEVDIAFHDQDLVAKFPENLVLPEQVSTIDAVLETQQFLYLFSGGNYWIYQYPDYALVDGSNLSANDAKTVELAQLDPENGNALRAVLRDDPIRALFKQHGSGNNTVHNLKVDAAFADRFDNHYLVSGNHYYVLMSGSDTWLQRENGFGHGRNEFDDLPPIDAAYTDEKGQLFLFSQGRYVRYGAMSAEQEQGEGNPAAYQYVDKGYPKSIASHWHNEGVDVAWPEAFGHTLDAAFHGVDGHAYFFKDHAFISSQDTVVKDISRHWGRVEHDLSQIGNIDAAYSDEGRNILFSGNKVYAYMDCLEHQGIRILDGFPKTIADHIADLPDDFNDGIDAAFKDDDGALHLFKDEYCVEIIGEKVTRSRTSDVWGKLPQHMSNKGRNGKGITAALTALDGATYVFASDHYFRYSKGDYTKPDSGYPRKISDDWHGLVSIDAAFALDGKTYLFGMKDSGEGDEQAVYLRYSTSDYTQVDHIDDNNDSLVKPVGNIFDVVEVDTFPREQDDQFWSLPDSLTAQGFDSVDAVLNTLSGKTLLFKDDRVVEFDQEQMSRWWSEPYTLSSRWPDLPFNHVDAAFAGKDGKTYLISGDKFVCFADPELCHLVDSAPSPISAFWKNTDNAIAQGHKIDAAFILTSREIDEDASVDQEETPTRHTYLLSGGQIFRYEGKSYAQVESGYPKPLTMLNDEPRFMYLGSGMEQGIDAVFADERNVYLFKDKLCHIVSEESEADYNKEAFKHITASLLENGRVYVNYKSDEQAAGNGWHALSAVEGKEVVAIPATPDIFDDAPDTMPKTALNTLSAVLQGTDGNTYFFDKTTCYNHLLNTHYDIDKEWGRANNPIKSTGHLDTGFVGRDGVTYVFADDMCYAYSSLNGLMEMQAKLDEPPMPIAEFWGPLRSVAAAFVWEKKTYLFEHADAFGHARYLVFETDDYQHETPQLKHSQHPCLWEMGDAQKQLGFADYDCMFIQGENAIFVKDKQFVRYHIDENNWSYPKDLTLLFPTLTFNKTTFKGVSNIIQGPESEMYFISHACFQKWEKTNTGDAEIYPVNQYWGLLDNPLSDGVDATLVHEGVTYLFSKDHYVRYSSADYRTVDEGYPKRIHIDLTKEIPFKGMGKAFQYALDTLAASHGNVRIRAAHTNPRNTYVLVNDQLFVGANAHTYSLAVAAIGETDNHFSQTGMVDAAVTLPAMSPSDKGTTYLFSGDQYVRYSEGHYNYVDAGYPKSISEFSDTEGVLQALPEQFHDDIEAAFVYRDELWLYKQGESWGTVSGRQQIAWGKVKNRFKEARNAGEIADHSIDGAYTDGYGRLYVFKHDQYVRYTDTATLFTDDDDAPRYFDDGYPKSIDEHEAHVPRGLYMQSVNNEDGESSDVNTETPPITPTDGLSSVFRFENRIFFVRDKQYVHNPLGSHDCHRFNTPLLFTERFARASDYLLRDIKLISQFAKLNKQYSGGDVSLAQLVSRHHQHDEPYWALSDMFGFEKEDIRWLKEKHAFLQSPTNDVERRFDVELIIRIYHILSTLQSIDVGAQRAYSDAWYPLYGGNAQPSYATRRKVAKVFNQWLFGQGCDDNFAALKDQLVRELNTIKRDALVPYAISQLDGIDDARDLYEALLIDVQMENEASTSRIKEATMALQLFFHRYFMQLESVSLSGETPANKAERVDSLKDKWEWMQNYRVWEANRKVFLYPENYIRPELRDTKTPPFVTLEQDVNQGEINDDNMQKVFKTYLDEYTEVSRLKIGGGYLYEEDALESQAVNKKLVLFGHTKSDPVRYYYRFGNFLAGETQNDSWESWLPVNIPIEAERVYPVYAFNRVFVFWAKVDVVPPNSNRATFSESEEDGKKTYENESNSVTQTVSIYYSYYNLNKEWIQPQKLITVFERDDWGGALTDVLLSNKGINDVKLSVELASLLNNKEHEHIRVVCQYLDDAQFTSNRRDATPFVKAFGLTPELYSVEETELTPSAISNQNGKALFRRLFDEGDIEEKNVVSLNTGAGTTDAPWICYDHKGGGFLCKPRTKALGDANSPLVIENNAHNLPSNINVDAAFSVDNTPYYISGSHYYTQSGETLSAPQSTQRFAVTGSDTFFNRVQAAFELGGKVFLLDDDVCVKYANFGNANEKLKIEASGENTLAGLLSLLGFDNANATLKIDEESIDPTEYRIVAAYGERDGVVAYLLDRENSKSHSVRVNTVTKEVEAYQFIPEQNGRWYAAINTSFSGVKDGKIGFDRNEIFWKPETDSNIQVGRKRISKTIHAALYVNGVLYLFSQGEYIAFAPANVTEIVNAVARWSNKKNINTTWLKEKAESQFDANAIRATYVLDNQLYLLNDTQVHCFAIADGKVSTTPKEGYPQSLPSAMRHKVSAAFTLKDANGERAAYVVCGDHYYRYPSGLSPHLVQSPKPIKGNISNIPATFQNNITAALNTQEDGKDVLYLLSQMNGQTNGHYVRYSDDTAMPYTQEDIDYEIVRLTSSTAKELNKRLFAKGMKGLLQLATQSIDETPSFSRGVSSATNIQVNNSVKVLPENNYLDFDSANGMYYWEIFFHAPFYIAQRLNAEQKFEMAKQWYEHIYDPTRGAKHWKFLPFIDGNTEGLVSQATAAVNAYNAQFGSNSIENFLSNDASEFQAQLNALSPEHVYVNVTRAEIKAKIEATWPDLSSGGTTEEAWKDALVAIRDSGASADDSVMIVSSLSVLTGLQTEANTFTGSKRNDALIVVNHLRYRKLSHELETANKRVGDIAKAAEDQLKLEPHKEVVRLFHADLNEEFGIILNSDNVLDTMQARFDTFKPQLAKEYRDSFAGLKHYIEQTYAGNTDIAPLDGNALAKLDVVVQRIDTPAANQFHALFQLVKWLYNPSILLSSLNALRSMGMVSNYSQNLSNFAVLGLNGEDFANFRNRFNDEYNAMFSEVTKTLSAGNALSGAITPVIDALAVIEGHLDNADLQRASVQQLDKYLHDPFDPHAIAGLRPIAYQKAIVMNYIDNVLDWGDMLFRQYTRESINEARMLYVLAYDLLGKKPDNMGKVVLSDDKAFNDLNHFTSDTIQDYDFLIDLENSSTINSRYDSLKSDGTVHDSITNPYFYVPENRLFSDYWTRVEDRLHKIRNSLNIEGKKQPLPLFQPPIDPMALVNAVAAGGSIGEALAMLNTEVPHYRFSYMLDKAKAYTDKLSQFGGELLGTIEKHEAEELEMLHNQQEATILQLNRQIKDDQITDAEANIRNLEKSLQSAKHKVTTYETRIEKGLIGEEETQVDLNIASTALMGVGALMKISGAVAYALPEAYAGPFIVGVSTGGRNVGDFLDKSSDALETSGDALSTGGEIAAIYAQFNRSKEDWELEKELAEYEVEQTEQQLISAKMQHAIAMREKQIHEQDIKHNRSIATFMKNKFSNQHLYQWMSSQLSGLYYQSYKMAHDIAMQAQKAFQFETATPEKEVNYIGGSYWDSRRKGLMSGSKLGHDLAMMEKAYMEQDSRALEITKSISLLAHDPLAYMELKTKGSCVFRLSEELFDHDFPGHYNRQVKTISLAFDIGEGKHINATLTQLNNRVLMSPDINGVKHLLESKGQPPMSIRSDWRANQQIALSHVDQYTENNGMFELRYDNERYLPFEGTGAVSLWKLDINGKAGSYNPNELLDVTIKLRYTAEQGGEAFASAVRGALKPYTTSAFLDLAYSFPDAWQAFMQSDSQSMTVTVPRSLFPNMSGGQIQGIYTRYEVEGEQGVSLILNDEHKLPNERFVEISNMTIARDGSQWTFTTKGDKQKLKNVEMILLYNAKT
ncbi:hemopexin repeat-containing protein [Aestuariibacter sp. AA17]|uniref:Hemopexin repeat-containing protein n=1 Tax=Fluctibacter corallii TaxID=2984329 RepID=A0ABT3A3Q9_9ALTE|nr:hemopexin repeat-containing protein [Aestuariibacter sp. AA17]MCV2883323.1 hemopexin repeat-containing protein [Aestuariibacter sp. AA17]